MVLQSPHALSSRGGLRNTKNQVLPALRIVIHITGRSTYLNAKKRRVPPLQHLGEYFATRGNSFAHYSIDPWGRIACHALESETPWSQGWRDYGGRRELQRKLQTSELRTPSWWLRQWGNGVQPYYSPIDLVDADCVSGNDRSVTIEFIQYNNQYLLTDAQYTYGHLLVWDVASRHGIALPTIPDNSQDNDAISIHPTRQLLGHEDLDPWGRGGSQGGWDPGYTRKRRRFSYKFLVHPELMPRHRRGSTHPLGTANHSLVLPTPAIPHWA